MAAQTRTNERSCITALFSKRHRRIALAFLFQDHEKECVCYRSRYKRSYAHARICRLMNKAKFPISASPKIQS